MDFWNIIIIVLVCLVSLVCIYYMYFVKKRGNIDKIIDEAVNESAYRPTVFKIYDKSSNDICNRLIIVSPFDWYIWACRGELYILNPEGGLHCAIGSTPAIRVFASQFIETCLKLDMNSILDNYTLGRIPTVVPYDIEGTTFTVLSALNILMKSYITFDRESVDLPHQSIKPLGRDLTPDDLIKITSRHHQKDTNSLHRSYRKHVTQSTTIARAKNISTKDLDQKHTSYITQRQHACDSDDFMPKLQNLFS